MKKIFLLVLVLVAQIYANSFDDGYYWQNIKKDDKKAIKYYTKAITKGEDLQDAYYNRGLSYYHLKQYKLAIADYGKSIEINPNDNDAFYNRALAYDMLDNIPLAIADYQQTIRINPKDKDAYHNLGLIYIDQKRYKEAKELAKTNCDMGDCELSDLIKKEGY